MRVRSLFVLLTILLGLHLNAEAKSYTKQEIEKMVAKKKYPKLGSAEQSIHKLNMADCEQLVSDYRVGFASNGWPTKIVVETSTKVVVEVWGTDAKTTFTCEDGESRVIKQKYTI